MKQYLRTKVLDGKALKAFCKVLPTTNSLFICNPPM